MVGQGDDSPSRESSRALRVVRLTHGFTESLLTECHSILDLNKQRVAQSQVINFDKLTADYLLKVWTAVTENEPVK